MRRNMRRASRGSSVIATVASATPSSHFRPVPLRIRYVALIAAAATVVGCVGMAPASASAQTAATPAMASALVKTGAVVRPLDSGETAVCLSNDNAYCATINPQDAEVILTGVGVILNAISIWLQIRAGIYKGKHGKYQELELSDNQNGLCLADTFGYAYLASCGANGTIWLVVPHNDGAYLESRYALDNGQTEVLTADPVADGARLYIYDPEQSGSPYWQTWTGYPSFP